MSSTVELGDLTWPGANALAPAAVLALPVGSTEQHGPHLPLSTDTDIAVGLATGLAAERGQVVLAPPLAYGSSGEHAGFPGTLSIGRDATELVLVELGRSASATLGRLLIICAHGGNAAPVGAAVRRLRDEGRDVRAFFPTWPGDAHAGRTETSLMLALAPDRVLVERAAAGAREPLAELMGVLARDGVAAVSPTGVLGDPSGASAGEGEALLESAVSQLVVLVDTWTADP